MVPIGAARGGVVSGGGAIPDSAIDYFSDGDISEYAENGAGSASVQSNTVFAGGNALELQNYAIASTTELDNYPAQGDRFRAYLRLSDLTTVAGFSFATDGTFGANDKPVGYAVELNSDFDYFLIRRVTSDSGNSLELVSHTYSTDTWYAVEGVYETDNTIEIELLDSDLNSLAGPITSTDSTHDGNTGVGWFADGPTVYGDAARLI